MRAICPEQAYSGVLLALASYALPGAVREFPTQPLTDDEWQKALRGAVTHRLIGELWSSIETKAFPVTTSQREQARHRAQQALFQGLFLESELVKLAELLDGADAIDFRVLKGAAVAHLDYQNPGLRSFVDLDILVRADDFDRTVHRFINAGFSRLLPEPRPGFDRRFEKGTTLVSPTGYEVDLHRTLVLGPWGLRVHLDDLWDAGIEFTIAGRSLRALSAPNRLLHACYHASLGDWPLRLASLRDVGEMLRDDDASEIAQNRAMHWGVESVVAAAIADTCRLLGIPPRSALATWAVDFTPSRRDERYLALHTQTEKTFSAQVLATFWALPGVRAKAAYARALALPDSQYVAGRHSSMFARLRHGLGDARRGRAGRAGGTPGVLQPALHETSISEPT